MGEESCFVFIHFDRTELDYIVRATNMKVASTILADYMSKTGGRWEWTMITARAIENTVKFYDRREPHSMHYFRIKEIGSQEVMEIR